MRACVWTGHQQPVNFVAYSPDGRLIASASFDNSVRLWHGTTGKFLAVFRGHVQAVYQVRWHDSRPARARWQRPGCVGLSLHRLNAASPTLQVCWSADSRLVASSSKDSTIKARGLRPARYPSPEYEPLRCGTRAPRSVQATCRATPTRCVQAAMADKHGVAWRARQLLIASAVRRCSLWTGAPTASGSPQAARTRSSASGGTSGAHCLPLAVRQPAGRIQRAVPLYKGTVAGASRAQPRAPRTHQTPRARSTQRYRRTAQKCSESMHGFTGCSERRLGSATDAAPSTHALWRVQSALVRWLRPSAAHIHRSYRDQLIAVQLTAPSRTLRWREW